MQAEDDRMHIFFVIRLCNRIYYNIYIRAANGISVTLCSISNQGRTKKLPNEP